MNEPGRYILRQPGYWSLALTLAFATWSASLGMWWILIVVAPLLMGSVFFLGSACWYAGSAETYRRWKPTL